MVNVLLPSMGSSNFFSDVFFPKPLIEICGKTMLELVMTNIQALKDSRLIYVFSQDDCSHFHLDDSVKLLAKDSKVLTLRNQTAGALCTSLIAIDLIDTDTPLIIMNSDQIIDVDYNDVVTHFEQHNADAGVITFPSIHPRWSYVKEKDGDVVEVAEKRPLSSKAIAGFYYYRNGHDFIKAAEQAICKKSCVEGKYYISSSINELILMGKKVVSYEMKNEQYHSFYSPEKIKAYEQTQRERANHKA